MITSALLIVVISLLAYVFYWARDVNQTWKRRGVKHKKPVMFFGNLLENLFAKQEQKHISILYADICNEFPDEPVIGFYNFTNPWLLVKDAEYIEKILIKDFVHFTDHGFAINEEKNPLDAQLFNMVGKRWRAFRYKLSPIFTSGKLKSMYEAMSDVGVDLDNVLQKSYKKELDFKELMTHFAVDVVGSSVFGIEVKSLQNPNNKFCSLATDLFTFGFFDTIKFIIMFVFPKLSIKLGVSFNNQNAVNYYSKVLKETFKYREENKIERNDFVQLLLTLKEKKKIDIQNWDPSDDYLKDGEAPAELESYEITEDVLMAQAYAFLVNGIDALALSQVYALYELSLKPDIQEKAQNEIREQIKLNNGITFTALKNMTYLEKIVKETLRLHPAGGQLFRICNKDYVFPNGTVIKEGEFVVIPMCAVHLNPNYHPEPDVFKPERFDMPMKPGSYLTFGDGPRVCIAMRYAILLIKYGIVKILSNYKIRLSPKNKLPIKFKPNAAIRTPESPLLFDLEAIN
ncbi:probable cytochrome P450 6a17 isoform X2 [Halyomorpha halys]|uniref:probable cytochrome P450 6a17 isoform X2 n=1 Tax=Halyomorpha halys TaxID=286706 RepID=UPI0006D4FE42|nr:probable cytochrome P450 6a17 [Halyomorpha halys]XP_014286447.1 probable cytochrome P450 6a17 [Halyomorpha halys]